MGTDVEIISVNMQRLENTQNKWFDLTDKDFNVIEFNLVM